MKLSASSQLISDIKYFKFYQDTEWEPSLDMTVQNSIMKHLESSLDCPRPATHLQFGHRRGSGGGGRKSSADFPSFNSTSKASLHHAAARSGASAQGWGEGGITATRSADGFSSIIWSLLLTFKQDVPSLTEGWRTPFLPPPRLQAMRATFSPPWVRLVNRALSSGHKERSPNKGLWLCTFNCRVRLTKA